MVVDQTPALSLVIFKLSPLSQLPFSVTSLALGARRRNVTLRSVRISGDRGGTGRGACAAGAAGGVCWPAATS
jgi:hypothetical protein